MTKGRVATCLVTLTAVATVAVIYSNYYINNDGWPITACLSYNYATAIFYCLTGIALLTVLVVLIRIIRKTFTNELNQEMK